MFPWAISEHTLANHAAIDWSIQFEQSLECEQSMLRYIEYRQKVVM